MNSTNELIINSNDADLVQYIEKDLELKVLKDNLSNNYDLLRQQKMLLVEEHKELDDVNFSVWDAEDEYCSEIWKFSLEHNFDALFNQSADISNPWIELDQINKKSYIAEVGNEANEMFRSLENEIDAIGREISFIREKDIKQELNDALDKLNNLRLLSEEISEVISLTKPQGKPLKNIANTHLAKNIKSPYSNKKKIRPCKDSLNDNGKCESSPVLRNQAHWKKSHKNNATEFLKAKMLLDKPICHPCIIIGKKVTIARTTVIERIKNEHSTGEKKVSKFVAKRRSHISLKLQPDETVSKNNL